MRATSHKCVYFLMYFRKKSLKISISPPSISSPRNPTSKPPYLLTKTTKAESFFLFYRYKTAVFVLLRCAAKHLDPNIFCKLTAKRLQQTA